MREKAIEPHTNAKADWWIFKSLAERLGVGEYFKFDDVEDFWECQLEGTGVSVEDLKKKGAVSLADKPIWWDRMNDLKFKTPSGKIELVSSHLTDCGLESFKPYERPAKPSRRHFSPGLRPQPGAHPRPYHEQPVSP